MSAYLLRTKPQGEAKAIAGLTRCGHVAWTPTEERVRRASRHTKKKRIVRYPLCSRYVIAETDRPFDAVHQVDEVSGVVGALRSHDVARLKAMDGQKAETVISKALAVGQQIRVRSGPFAGWPTVIDAINGRHANITLNMMGRPTSVELPLDWLDPG